jgi:hypothetical protein
MKNAINAEYGTAGTGGWLDRIVTAQRRKLFEAFNAFSGVGGTDRVLSVGIMPTGLFDKPDYLLAWSDAPRRARLTSYEIEPPRIGPERGAPPAKEIRLPFKDGEFDWVFCNEVIEHAGSFERQFMLVKELYRVARKGVFVTTPNRRHPLEFHTGLPLLHLLPAAWWRRLLKMVGKGMWASESVLNPLDSATLYRFACLLPGLAEHDVGHKRVWGVKAHFFLMLYKAKQADPALH